MAQTKNKINQLLKKIEYQFHNQNLLIEALTHPSINNNKQNNKNYQRLEFLGDSVLSMVIAEMLLLKYPNEQEGKLSKRQAHLVNGKTLSDIAIKIELGQAMIFSKNEEENNGRNNKRNLENGLEALIGAIYLDSGLDKCQKFVKKYWQNLLNKDLEPHLDPVSNLQEIIQSKNKTLPQYQTIRSGGTEHNPIFTSKITINEQEYSATGPSKKEAQKKAAQQAIIAISNK